MKSSYLLMEKIKAAFRHLDNYIFLAGILSIIFLNLGFSQEGGWSMIFILAGIVSLSVFWIRYSGTVLSFVREYGRYFYISLIYFAILGVVLANFEQANSLFLNFLEDGWNNSFYMFSVQLPLSIMVVWFLPYYLMFSKSFYREFLGKEEAEHMSWGDFFANVFFPFQAVILKISAFNPEGGQVLKQRFRSFNEESKNLHKIFHITRRIAGAIYILILMRLLEQVGEQLGSSEWYVTYCTEICIGMILLFYAYAWCTNQWVFYSDVPRDNSLRKPGVFWLVVLIWFLIFIGLSLINKVFPFGWNTYNVVLISSAPTVLGLIAWWLWPLSKSLKVPTSPGEEQASKASLEAKSFLLYGLVALLLGSAVWAIFWLIKAPGNETDAKNIERLILSGYGLLMFFMSFAYLRRKGRYAFGFEKQIGGVLRVLDEPGNAILMVGNLGLLILFLAAFFGAAIHYEKYIANNAYHLNPINVFFLFVNGLIALISFVDRALVIFARYLSLKKAGQKGWFFLRKTQEDRAKTKLFFQPNRVHLDGETVSSPIKKVILEFSRNNRVRVIFNTCLIGLIVLIAWRAKKGNEYHSLHYHEVKSPSSLSLAEYTENFLAKHDSTHPVYIIAGDGGGLKAAYWTLEVLSNLEQNQPNRFDFATDVFVSAGASGSSVGLGMYTYMYAIADRAQREHPLFHAHLDNKIDSIGAYNLLSADFIGLFSRWPLKLWPGTKGENNPDRMDILARNMFINAGVGNEEDFNAFNLQAYAQLWSDYETNGLPLFVTNTARMEDGSRGFMHPLDPEEAGEIWGGAMDLTYIEREGKNTAISFSDALMTTNRFPIFSPMAKIEGRGHFVDAGAVDNSGKGTILQLLQYMKQEAEEGDTTFCKFFDKCRIVLLSIRCDKQRYYYEQFKDFVPEMTNTDQQYYLSTYLGGAINTGLTGGPRQYEGLMDQESHRKAHGLDAEVVNLSIPFYVESLEDIFSVLGSRVEKGTETYQTMGRRRTERNDCLYQIMHKNPPDSADSGNKRPAYLEPPLARTLSRSTMTYMSKAAAYISEDFRINYHPDATPSKQ